MRPSPLPPFVCVYRSSQWGQLTQWTSSCHREQVVPTSAAALICLHPATTSLVPVVTAAPASPPAVEPHRLLHTLQVRKHTRARKSNLCMLLVYQSFFYYRLNDPYKKNHINTRKNIIAYYRSLQGKQL